jgi:hypothetical protein
MNIDDNIVSEDGFVNLFNGIDQEGWTIAGPSTLVSKQVGEWNTFEIHALGQNYTVILNEITLIPKLSGTAEERIYWDSES